MDYRIASVDEPHLAYLSDRWVGIHPGLKNPLSIDFNAGSLARRARQGNETLAKATGAAKGLSIVDATAGLGRDAFLMSAAGGQVTAIECSPTLGFWLENNALGTDLSVVAGNAMDWLQTNTGDVVYLDPMFPHRQKSAAVGGESLFLQAFAPPPNDDEQRLLLQCALEHCQYRVVVKRPVKAPPLADQPPSASLKGKAVRFDIYGKRRLPS